MWPENDLAPKRGYAPWHRHDRPRSRDSLSPLCTDGLTKHVTDARIAEVLGAMESAEQACRVLVDQALEAGGTDNVTVFVGRGRRGRMRA